MIETIVLVAYAIIAGAVLLRAYQHNVTYHTWWQAFGRALLVAIFWPIVAMYAGLQLVLEED